ncbi:hypothetical protein H0G86_003199 [Trichoderma simmonsii]|uniref:Uncharacterized protein n=1 Tax=Trichoderma simmonsii TaxID=1491479 RepID=A0A8G0L515_9HYPO|nr:hypothetical protein H0G86_003199 [Trichoderma simmonsii]
MRGGSQFADRCLVSRVPDLQPLRRGRTRASDRAIHWISGTSKVRNPQSDEFSLDTEAVDLDTNELEVMERDRRLTGTLRGQTDNPEAPLGFEFSNGWKVKSTHIHISSYRQINADTAYSWRRDSPKEPNYLYATQQTREGDLGIQNERKCIYQTTSRLD